LIIAGNPEQSRFMLKPLHPDGGGSYTVGKRFLGIDRAHDGRERQGPALD
jgi:hypothetical protein